MSEIIKFKAEPHTVIHNGSMIPIKFDSRGEFATGNARDIEIVRSRKYVEEVAGETATEDAPKETKAEKKAREEAAKAEAARLKAEEKAAKAEADKQSGDGKAGQEAPTFHTITEEDIKNNPALGEKYKVGDSVDLASL